jgi:hypothetical protein
MARLGRLDFFGGAVRESKRKRKPRIPWAKIRDRVHELAKKLRREVTPRDVLRDAEDPKSVMHGFFEWDNRRAAAAYRIQQARQLLGRLKVIYHDALGNEIRVREYIRLVHEAPATHELRAGYFPRTRALTNSGLEQQCVERAISELESWMNRWRGFHRIEAAYAGVQASLAQLRRLKQRIFRKTK